MPTVYIETHNIMKKRELNEKQKLFCLEYLKTFNATASYKKVYGVSQKTAEVNGTKLLGNTRVAEYLSSKAAKKIEKVDVGVDYVLENLKNIVEIGSGRKTVELEEGKEKKVLDLSNVNSALEKLGKYHKLFTDKVEQSGDLNINIVSYKSGQK